MPDETKQSENPKTILYVGGFELPDKNAAAHRVVSNAKILKALGFQVVFLDINRSTKKSVLHTKTTSFGFPRYSMQYRTGRLISIKDIKSVYQLYADDMFAVIAYNYPGIALALLRGYCRKRKIKLIADCTEWYGFIGDGIFKRCIKGLDSLIRMNLVQPKLDGMIVISRYLEKYYKDKLPTICVPPLVDLGESKWNRRQEENTDKLSIVYAGNPGKHKDKINKILQAIDMMNHSGINYQIVGIEKQQYLSYYPQDRDLLERLKGVVTFRGRLPHLEALEYIKRADFSMFFRNITRVSMAGFPTKFTESISCGTPVLTNQTSNLDEYFQEGQNGFWLTEDIAGSLNAIFQMDPNTLKHIKAEMDRTVFDYHKFIDLFGTLFEKREDDA